MLSNLSTIIYGLLVIVFLLFEPAGFVGLIRRIQVVVRRRESGHKGGDSALTLAASATDSQLEVEVSQITVTQINVRTDATLPNA